MYTHRNIYTIAILTAFALVTLMAVRIATHNRIILPGSKTVTIQTPDQAYAVWQKNGVKGRTIILFDNYPHMKGLRSYNGLPQLSQWNVIEYSIFKNIIRRIYLVVPEETWSEFLNRGEIRPISKNSPNMQSIYLTTTSGVPLITSTPTSIQILPEKVLIYINTSFYDYDKAITLLREKGIQSDLIIIYRGDGK